MSTLYSIAGVVMPTPSVFDVGVQDISKAERNASGYMIIERIATKRKISINYHNLDPATVASVLQKVSGTSFTVNYLDPQTGGFRSAEFYCGDRNIGMVSFVGGQPVYKDIKFDLVER